MIRTLSQMIIMLNKVNPEVTHTLFELLTLRSDNIVDGYVQMC